VVRIAEKATRIAFRFTGPMGGNWGAVTVMSMILPWMLIWIAALLQQICKICGRSVLRRPARLFPDGVVANSLTFCRNAPCIAYRQAPISKVRGRAYGSARV